MTVTPVTMAMVLVATQAVVQVAIDIAHMAAEAMIHVVLGTLLVALGTVSQFFKVANLVTVQSKA